MGFQKFESYISTDTRWFPTINWNIKFFGAHMQTVEKGWLVPEESHHAFELIYILKGHQHTLMEGLQYELQEGDILLIPPGFKHINQCTEDRGLTYFVAHFNVDDPLFRQKMSRSTLFYFQQGTEDNQKLKDGVVTWINLLKRGGEYTISDLFKVQSGLFEILSILPLSISSSKEKSISPTRIQYATLIAESIKIHFRNVIMGGEKLQSKEIRIDDIASSLNISSGYAQEVFKELYNVSPRQYLSELKLHEANQLIHQPNLDLTRIASILGYSSLAHFSRQYKRWTGVSPIEYRQKIAITSLFEKE